MPITKEQWSAITDEELEHSDRIEFTTPRGKKVLYKKVTEDGTLVEVVRCKDCKWWGDLDPKNRYTDCYCHVVECSTEHDWYCADGERKEDPT